MNEDSQKIFDRIVSMIDYLVDRKKLFDDVISRTKDRKLHANNDNIANKAALHTLSTLRNMLSNDPDNLLQNSEALAAHLDLMLEAIKTGDSVELLNMSSHWEVLHNKIKRHDADFSEITAHL